MEDRDDALLDRLWDVRFRIGYSVRYHRDRERMLDLLDKGAKAIAVIGGTATVTTLINKVPELVLWVGVAITVSSVLSLVFDLARRARVHNDAARKLLDLEARIARVPQPGLDQIAEFEADLAVIERDEPASLTLLVQDCQNREAIARGCFEDVHPIPAWKKPLMHFFSLSVSPKAAKTQ